jgi:hypothetical protein
MLSLVGLLDTRRLIKRTRRELGRTAPPASSIRQITANDSVCIVASLEDSRELRVEHHALGERQIFTLSIQTALALPRPLSYDPRARCFSADDPFGRLLNGDAHLLRLLRRVGGDVTMLPGHQQCLIRVECRRRRRLWTASPPVRRFLRAVDRIEAILGGVCNQTSELHPVMPEFNASEPTEPNRTVDDIFSSFGEIFSDFFEQTRGPGGADLRTELTLSQLEIVRGCRRPVTFDRQVLCPACDGRGGEPGSRREPCPDCSGRGHAMEQRGFFMINRKCARCGGARSVQARPCRFCDGSGIVTKDQTVVVTIPAGVVEGATLRLKGMGNQSAVGETGDLFVELRVESA